METGLIQMASHADDTLGRYVSREFCSCKFLRDTLYRKARRNNQQANLQNI